MASAPAARGAASWTSEELSVPLTGRTGFVPASTVTTGVAFTNRLSDLQIARNRLSEDGSGVAAGDVDGDGRCDLYFCGLDVPNALYRNLGDWRFEEVASKAGVACEGQLSTGAVLADLDGDTDLDLLVNALGRGTRCFLNDGRGRFTEAREAGFPGGTGSRSLALADVEGDGDLDVYVVNYRATTVRDTPLPVKVRRVGGRWEVPPEHRERFLAASASDGTVALLERGEPDVLLLNDGRARFTPVPWTGGRFLDESGRPLEEAPRDWGLSAMFRDINGDGRPDLYVCNDFFTPDRIWLNQGGGVLRALPSDAIRKTAYAAMAVDFADLDRDGHEEIFVTEMLSRDHARRQVQHSLLEMPPLHAWGWGWDSPPGEGAGRLQVMRNTLLHNRGDGTYAEIAMHAGVHASEWTWGLAFCDVDLDGFEDLLVANGHGRDVANSDALAEVDARPKAARPEDRLPTLGLFPPLPLPHLAFRNRGDLTFEETGEAWGFHVRGAANGMALADLDGDGDQDVVFNHLNGPAALLRNESSAPRVAVVLRGAGGLTQGTGARIRVLGGPVPQSQEMIAGGRYLSGDDARRTFAAGSATHLSIEVTWPDGRRSTVPGVRPNQLVRVNVSGAAAGPTPLAPVSPHRPHFVDESARLGHRHHEEPFDDFARQPLLPRRLSQLGPGLAWCDVDGDGRDDLVIGDGRGGRLRVSLNDGAGGFRPIDSPAWSAPLMDDLAGIVGWSPEPGSGTLWAAQASYELGEGAAGRLRRWDAFFGEVRSTEVPVAPMGSSSPGPVAAADFDGDGDLDVFVGGRLVPGKYPARASSMLLRAEGRDFLEDPGARPHLAEAGLVSGAVWTDLENDGFPELVLACDTGPLRVLRNRGGRLEPWDVPLRWPAATAPREGAGRAARLEDLRGWWNGVTAGDVDGDGRLDLVGSNWGSNGPYREFLEREWRVFHGDVDGDGTWDVIEAFQDPGTGRLVPWRDFPRMKRALRGLAERCRTYREYAALDVEALCGEGFSRLREERVGHVESTLFLNRGDHFEVRPLPPAAQWAPAFGVVVADFDGDLREDLFLAQNFFGTDMETGRYDAGQGLWLRGDGRGGFLPVPAVESGLRIPGEQRAAAVSDFDGDGRVDLAVSQSGAGARLYRNQGARPGLRVRLVGEGANSAGFGATLRLGHGDRWGPLREVRAGGGYWSQDGVVQVLARPDGEPLTLRVRWPGGAVSSAAVPPGARAVRVSARGGVEVEP